MGISIWQLVLVLVIILVLFGAKKLRTLGGDLGGAVKGFRQAMADDSSAPEALKKDSPATVEHNVNREKEKQDS